MNLDKLKAVICEVLELEETKFHWDIAINSVPGWDSMGHMNLIFAIEEAFQVQFGSDEIPELKSLKEITAALERLTGT